MVKIKQPEEVSRLLAELDRRAKFYQFSEKEAFKEQLDFILDPSKRKALFVARRSGKTTAIAIYMLTEACIYPGRKFLYLGITQDAAEQAIWQHGFERLLIKYKITYKYNANKKIITLANKSTIRLGGVDSSWKDMNKYLGSKNHMIVIDECQDQTQDLQKLIDDKLSPAVADYLNSDGGIIVLAGTAGEHMGEKYWYRVTKTDNDGQPLDRLKGWAVHSWRVTDNPNMADEFGKVCAGLLASKGPLYQDDPSFQRQWLCRWVAAENSIIYKYDAGRNALDPNTPEDKRMIDSLFSGRKEWIYIIGVDLGWEDATAIVVTAHKMTDNHFYILESHKMNHTVLNQIGGFLVQLNAKYNARKIVVDAGGGGKLAAESLRDQFRLPIYSAQKPDKEASIGRMNSDFVCGQIQVITPSNKELLKEWSELIIDPKAKAKGDFKEHNKYNNHLADAALYAFKESQHQFAVIPEQPKEPDFADRLIARKKQLRNPYDEQDYYERYEQEQEARSIIAQFRGIK